jgi:hypothetical protein
MRYCYFLILSCVWSTASARQHYNKASALATGKDVIMFFSSAGCGCTPAFISQVDTTKYAIWWNQYEEREAWYTDKLPVVIDSVVGSHTYYHYDFKYPYIVIFNATDTLFLVDTPNPYGMCFESYLGMTFNDWLHVWEQSVGIVTDKIKANVTDEKRYDIWNINGFYLGYIYPYQLKNHGVYFLVDAKGNKYKFIK